MDTETITKVTLQKTQKGTGYNVKSFLPTDVFTGLLKEKIMNSFKATGEDGQVRLNKSGKEIHIHFVPTANYDRFVGYCKDHNLECEITEARPIKPDQGTL